jgi:preprotein translocase subunit SecD
MRFIKYLFLLLIAALIIAIALPENYPLRFQIGSWKVNYTVNPLTIDGNLFGKSFKKEFRTKLGLDLKGGSHLVFEADTTKVPSTDLQDALNSARDIIEKRVNLFGVSEPSVQTVKSGNIYRINVDLPGIQNVNEAVQLIGQTASLSFREEATSEAKVATDEPPLLNLTKDTGITGKHVKKASVVFDPNNGKPQVGLTFTEEGKKLFADATERNIGKPIGIFLDYFIISAPRVSGPILDGNAVISGNFTIEEAKQLAVAINSGALPVPIKLVEVRNIGPTLGAAEVQKSVTAGVVGLAMVMLFMVLFYGRLGLIACLGLVIYGLISFAIFRAIPVVLTLPGVAGFILSIGMAVDSNILIFERIKEERRKGKAFALAVRLGFGRAIDAIKDANITTLLVAFILFNPLNWEFLPQFGLIKGFALTLAIGVATSLFTGIVITQRLIKFFYRLK